MESGFLQTNKANTQTDTSEQSSQTRNKTNQRNKDHTQREREQGRAAKPSVPQMVVKPVQQNEDKLCKAQLYGVEQISNTQDELQWIVAQRLLSALTIPGFK